MRAGQTGQSWLTSQNLSLPAPDLKSVQEGYWPRDPITILGPRDDIIIYLTKNTRKEKRFELIYLHYIMFLEDMRIVHELYESCVARKNIMGLYLPIFLGSGPNYLPRSHHTPKSSSENHFFVSGKIYLLHSTHYMSTNSTRKINILLRRMPHG